MQITITQSIRAFHRITKPLEEGFEAQSIADRAYDCGEFSGGAVDIRYDKEYNRLLALVAARTGYTVEAMLHEMYRLHMEYFSAY